MSHLKITHDSELCFNDNDEMKVLCQKLHDKPFRTCAHLKSKQPLKLFKETFIIEDNTSTVHRIRLKEPQRETKGLPRTTSTH